MLLVARHRRYEDYAEDRVRPRRMLPIALQQLPLLQARKWSIPQRFKVPDRRRVNGSNETQRASFTGFIRASNWR